MNAMAQRARQFFGALRVREDGIEEACAQLTPAQQALFGQQTPRDRLHAVNCWRALAGGDESLRLAALLHDIAKGDQRLHERVLFVLLDLGPQALLERAASSEGGHWRRSLDAALHHAERGAALAEDTGAPAEAVRLIRRHHEPITNGDRALLALQRADDKA